MDSLEPEHLAPFILYARSLSAAQRSDFRCGALDRSLGMFVVWDGTIEVEPSRGAAWRLRAGEAGLLDPGCVLTLGARAHAGLIVLDLVPRPHARNQRDRAWHPADDRIHPLWSELLGTTLPLIAPAHLRADAVDTLTTVLSSYWRHPLAAFEATMRLGLLIARWARPAQSLVERFRSLVSERAYLGQGLAEYIAVLGVSTRQLIAACRAELGCLPSALLDAERMALAERWLREKPDLPVRTVARWSGYLDHSAFGRRFRRQHGCTPQAWHERQIAAMRTDAQL